MGSEMCIRDSCPVGALTSTAYRFRARPWDIEGSGTVCTMCPSQCNVELTVRDDAKVVRVLARDNEEVDDGWLCDKGRFGYQAFGSPERITAPLVRDGGLLREVSWERALTEAARALQRAGERTAALVGGFATNEEGFLVQHLLRHGLGSPHVDSRAAGRLSGAHARALAAPALSARACSPESRPAARESTCGEPSPWRSRCWTRKPSSLVAVPPTNAAVRSPPRSSSRAASVRARSHETWRRKPPSRTSGAVSRSGDSKDW